jgi:hypothetical protein
MFNREVIYRLYLAGQGGACDWKIKAVRTTPSFARQHSARLSRQLVTAENANLERRYGLAEARYRRYERKAEIESWRKQGYARPPRERGEVKRDEIIRAFTDHSIVFEPKSTPQGQEILPFKPREEAMANGR